MENRNLEIREKVISSCSRVVVKVGTRLLTDPSRIPLLIDQIAKLRSKGIKVMLVSSGAVGIGMKTLGLEKRPKKLSEIQGLAAVGQSKLMSLYEKECTKHGFHSAQLLLTADGLRNRDRHLNALNCINSLWSQDILPIINENDSVSIDELKFGDNDSLAGLLATMTRSELTIILTTVSGLHSRNGKELGERISVVESITDELRGMASGTDDSSFSIGGMISKLTAADIVTAAGEYLWVADGRKSNTLEDIFDAKDVGTVFLPAQDDKQMQSRKRWISFFSEINGQIILDQGAIDALIKGGVSLLPSGIASVEGNFSRGDTVELCDNLGVVIGRGLTNYNSEDCSKILGKQSNTISSILKCDTDEAVIHTDNLALVSNLSKT